MIELYHNDMSVCAQKVRFALAEKELSWQGHHLSLRAGDQQKRRSYTEALEKWFNANYLPLMNEKGAEVQPRIKGIVAGG